MSIYHVSLTSSVSLINKNQSFIVSLLFPRAPVLIKVKWNSLSHCQNYHIRFLMWSLACVRKHYHKSVQICSDSKPKFSSQVLSGGAWWESPGPNILPSLPSALGSWLSEHPSPPSCNNCLNCSCSAEPLLHHPFDGCFPQPRDKLRQSPFITLFYIPLFIHTPESTVCKKCKLHAFPLFQNQRFLSHTKLMLI